MAEGKYISGNESNKFEGCVTPLLIVPNYKKTNRYDSWIVYKIADDNLLESDLLPRLHDWAFDGSSEGWLGTVTRRYELILCKPFGENKTILRLPSLIVGNDRPGCLAQGRKYWLLKFATFTPDPIQNPLDFICLAIFGSLDELACIRPGKDKKWTRVKKLSPNHTNVNDVVYHNNHFYAITEAGMLVFVDALGTSKPRLKDVLSIPYPHEDEYNHDILYREYLVESPENELLFIKRYVDYDACCTEEIYITTKFLVWKLSYDGATPKWEKLESLGQCALFLGVNSSTAVLASTDNHICKKNSIYFTNDKDTQFIDNEHCDMGVYNMETKTFKRGFGIEESANRRCGRFSIFIDGRN